MNIALDWFLQYGMQRHDSRTTENVLDDRFVSHAKTEATAEEQAHIDSCITFQKGGLVCLDYSEI